ncbi:hypothetical protein JCM3770_003521 [Rhodotorula araucariae]
MADSPPHPASRSPSIGLGRPSSHAQPVAIPDPASTSTSSPRSLAASTSPSSALSHSLKAFADLHLAEHARSPPSGNPLDSLEFREAFHHARRASFGALPSASPVAAELAQPAPAAAAVPALSSSPSSSSEAGTSAGSLPTPSSSPPAASKARTAVTTTVNGNGKAGRPPASTLGGVCEGPELALERGEFPLEGDIAMSAPVRPAPPAITPPTGGGGSGGLFAGGARWGWPGVAAPSGPLSPPSGEPFALPRRGSISFVGSPASAASGTSAVSATSASSASSTSTVLATSPPGNGAAGDPARLMQPLGRVVSAGAALQTPEGKSGVSEGLGIFRRFSISGIGARKPRPPQPPSPPVGFSAQPAPTLLEPTHASLPPPVPTSLSATAEPTRRGRTLAPPGSTGAKAKRKISPMGEKILRGGY